MSYVIVKMYIDAGFFTHNTLHCHKVLIHPIQIAFFIPNIAIHLLLECTDFLNIKVLFDLPHKFCYLWITTYIYLFGIVCSAGKGRIHIDEIYEDSLISQISTSRKTLASYNHIMVGILANLLF